MMSPETSPGMVKKWASGWPDTSSVPIPWKYCHPVHRVPTSVESNSARIKNLMPRTVRTSCPTMTAMSNIANHPVLCQLNVGAAENRQEMAHQTKKESNGARSGCPCNFSSITILTAHNAAIAQNAYRATKMQY